MSKLQWLLSAFALATLAGVTQLWILEGRRTPETLLASARERLEEDPPDADGALHELGLGLARTTDTTPEWRDILLERAGIFHTRSLRSASRVYDATLAYEDCLTVLERHPADRDALTLAVRCALDADLPSEALALAERLAAVATDLDETEILIGQAHTQLAARALADVARELDAQLASEPAARVLASVRRAAALPPGDARRNAALDELRAAVPAREFQRRALAAIELASTHNQAAGQAWVRRLARGPDALAVAGLQALSRQGGATEAAIDLGQLALESDRLRSRAYVLLRTLETLLELDRRTEARTLLAEARELHADAIARGRALFEAAGGHTFAVPELFAWCRVVLELERWEELEQAGAKLRWRASGSEVASVGSFFVLTARVRRERLEDVEALSRELPPVGAAEAFPGIHFATWMIRADAARLQGRPETEVAALARALAVRPARPTEPALRATLGDAYLRLGSFHLAQRDFVQAERLLTHALTLLPSRREEIEPLWARAGQEAAGVRVRRVVERASPGPPGEGTIVQTSPYADWARAKDLFERGDHRSASRLLRAILVEYPGMPLALELQARNELAIGVVERAIENELALAEAGFHDRETPSFLPDVPREHFRGDQLVRWILVEPTRVPRPSVREPAPAQDAGEVEGELARQTLERARLLARRGDAVAALEVYGRLVAAVPVATAPVIPEVIRLLRRAHDAGQVSEGYVWAQLEVLAAERPDDPLLARQLAELTLSSRETTLGWGVDRAWELLERFRDRHRPASVESLRPGEARQWAELLGRYEPAYAERFARDELAADPLSPALWHLWARTLAGAGRHREALRAFDAITTLVDDTAIERDRAVLLANVENDLSALRALDAPSEDDPDPEWVMRRGLALARGNDEERRQGLADARRVWARRAEVALPERELGRRFALALAREGLADEARSVLEQAAAEERDPVRRAVLEAAGHLLR